MDYSQLKIIVDKVDPIGLLSMGAPKNEYDQEIKSISNRLREGQTKQEIRKIVFDEFIKWFGEDTIKGREDLLKQIAENIYSKKLRRS